MTSEVIEYLREHGPTTAADLPGDVKTHDRMNGAWRFDLNVNSRGSAQNAGGRVQGVWYLEGEHDREAVVRAFLDENPRLVESKMRRALRQMLRRNGRQWHDAIDEVFPIHG